MAARLSQNRSDRLFGPTLLSTLPPETLLDSLLVVPLDPSHRQRDHIRLLEKEVLRRDGDGNRSR